MVSSVASTLLDPVETNVTPDHRPPTGSSPDPHTSDVAFRHSGWHHDRSLIRDALGRVAVSESRLNRWDSCGAYAWVVRHPTDRGRLKIMASFCHDRFCKPCAAHRSRLVVANLRGYLVPKMYRFLTLTLRSDTEPLTDLIDKLYRCFRRLRAGPLCKRRLRGGIAFLEVQWMPATERWHPHLHVICEGTYLPKDQLAAEWLRITGDSYVVDIRSAGDLNVVTGYVAKYASKPMTRSFFMLKDRLDEAIRALSGRRMFTTFGTWRGWPLLKCTDTTEWEPVAPLSEIRQRAVEGDPWAVAIFDHLRSTQPWTHPTNPIRDPPDETLDSV